MKTTIDNFSEGAQDYALYRPASPKEIFDFLYSKVNKFTAAWDCGTGNGQAAVALSEKFKTVYATDISADQLAQAQKKGNIIYRQERAERTSIADGAIDLITVAQAIHWFDFDSFYKEVRRVATPDALFAAWTYNLLSVTPEIDKIIHHLYFDITHRYWDKERHYVEENYTTIPFPFREIKTPEFAIHKKMNIRQLTGYLHTWSGVKHYIKQTGNDPVAELLPDLQQAWGKSDILPVKWPMAMRAGFVV